MFNLLPENEKQNIMKEYLLRRNIVLCVFIFGIGIVASISLFPSFILSGAKIQETQAEIQSIKNSETFQESGTLSNTLEETNTKLKALGSSQSNVSIVDLLGKISTLRDVNIRITTIMYQEGSGSTTPGAVSISGIAHDRASLSAFVDRLKAEPLFSQVDLPVGDLAKDRNADFSISIQGNF